MSTVARLVLTGICMFSRPEANKPPDAALFMDGRSHAAAHHVFLAVNAEKYDVTDTGTLPLEDWTDAGGTKYTVVKLDDLLIQVNSTVLEHVVNASNFKVTEISRVWPRIMFGAHSRAAALRTFPRDPSLRTRLNARLNLPHGTLETRPPDPTQWQFDPNVFLHRHVETPIAQEVTMTSTIDGSSLMLGVYNFDNDHPMDVITITPRPGVKEIETLLANVPRDDVFAAGSCANVDCTQTPDHICCTDHHFALYYNAYARQPRRPPVPHRILSGGAPTDDLVHLQRVGAANCGPTEP